MTPVTSLIGRVDRALALPSDGEDERNEKLLTASVVAAGVLALLIVGSALYPMGLVLAGRLCYAAAVYYLAIDVLYVRTHGSRAVLYAMIAVDLLLPFMLQWTMGGIWASGVTMLWGLSVPVGLPLVRARGARLWFVAYLALVVLAAVMEANGWHPAVAASTERSAVLAAINVGSVSLLVFVFLGRFMDAFRAAKRAVQRERERSETLLLNILPAATAERLKSGETVIADRYESATVLFADIVGFTPFAAHLPADVVVGVLNDLFTAFDDLAGRYGLEKIKTIGDSYMAVSGVPIPRPDHAVAAVEMAQEMLAVIERYRREREAPIAVRVGLNSGPLLAGVIGKRKFAYDVYGDTVNTASRMESYGVPGEIHVSDATYHLLRDHYEFARREPIEVKGKGTMTTYLLRGRQAAGSPVPVTEATAPGR